MWWRLFLKILHDFSSLVWCEDDFVDYYADVCVTEFRIIICRCIPNIMKKEEDTKQWQYQLWQWWWLWQWWQHSIQNDFCIYNTCTSIWLVFFTYSLTNRIMEFWAYLQQYWTIGNICYEASLSILCVGTYIYIYIYLFNNSTYLKRSLKLNESYKKWWRSKNSTSNYGIKYPQWTTTIK